MVKKILPGKGGSPGQPYDAPKEDPNNPYVPAPKTASQSDETITADYNLHLEKLRQKADVILARVDYSAIPTARDLFIKDIVNTYGKDPTSGVYINPTGLIEGLKKAGPHKGV
jgi:hypothetical protein